MNRHPTHQLKDDLDRDGEATALEPFGLKPFCLEPRRPALPAEMVDALRAADAGLENTVLVLSLIIAIGCFLAGLPLASCAITGFAAGSLAGIGADMMPVLIDDDELLASYPRKVHRS